MFKRNMSLGIALIACFSTLSAVQAQENIAKAVAVVHPTKGNTVNGVVTFTVVKDGVRIVADIDGLKPGQHGFHIHEFGDCSAPDATSAGGHFNPTNKKHGCPGSPEHHVGDLGNIDADNTGHAHLEVTNKRGFIRR